MSRHWTNIGLAGGPGFAGLGTRLGYYLPHLPALHPGRGWCFVASGSIFETDAKSHSPQRAQRAQQKGKTYHRGGDAKEIADIAVIAGIAKSKPYR